MITNNDVREFLKLPRSNNSFIVTQVDSLDKSTNNTLMFVSKADLDIISCDKKALNNIYLLDKDLYDEYTSEYNDFIRIENPKFKFCNIVKHFHLLSRFQMSTDFDDINHIGKGCHIDSGTIIGGEDFSPVLADDGSLVQFPQMGGVEIGDYVTVKYNSMVGKGTFGRTRIGDNTMIDFGCQIGHNCNIGKRCIIAAGTIIGGSTIVGDNTVIGIGAKIRNGINIGKNVSVGMGSVVIKDVPDNVTVVGNPARIIEHKHIFDKKGLV